MLALCLAAGAGARGCLRKGPGAMRLVPLMLALAGSGATTAASGQ
jgi:hypothetical protein